MEHRSAQLKISGEGAPEVEKLQNGRYRLEFRCTGFSKTEDWYYENVEGKLFADFGSLMDAEMLIDGIGGSEAIPASVYPDMRLRENRLEYTPSGALVVYLAYESLSDTFVQVKDDNVDYELNGLRRVTRPLIAKAGTSYAKVVGTDTISHSVAGGGAVTLTLGGFSIDNDDAATTITETWLEPGIISQSNDYVGSELAIVIEAIGEAPTTPTGYSIAKTDVRDYEGFSTNVYTFLKDGAVLSKSRDSVGSQQAVVFEVFNGTPTTAEANAYGGGSSYVIANERESDVDGIPTRQYTFLEPSILSVQTPKVGGQQQVSVVAFNQDEATVTAALAEVTGSHKLVNQSTKDYEGISTNDFIFEVDDFDVLSATESGLKQIQQTQLSTSSFTRGTVGTDLYSTLYLVSEEIDNGNTIKKRVSLWSEAGILNQSNDLVGSQQAIVIQAIGEAPATPVGYSLAKTSVGNFEGFKTNDYTFLEPSILSQSSDLVSSQQAITIEAFNETPSTPAGYALAKTDVSDFEGIPTNRYTFLEPCEFSRSNDLVGSQQAEVVEVFGTGNVPTATSGTATLAKKDVSNVDGIPTTRYTFLEPSVLSVTQGLVGGQTTVSASAFNLTESQVDTLLAEVTATHLLVSQKEDDYEGVKTSTFTYEVEDFEVLSESENGLKVINRVELSTTSFPRGDVGTDGNPTDATLILAREEIDNGNTIKKRTSKWVEPGKVFERVSNPSDGIKSVTTGWWHTIGTITGAIISKDTQEFEGFNIFTIEAITAPDGTDITDGENDKKVADFETLTSWTRPGVVAISETIRGATSATSINVWQKPPCQMKVRAHVEIYFSKSEAISDTSFDTITGGTGVALWNPDNWVALDGKSAGTYAVDEVNRTYRGFRAVDSTDAIYSAIDPKYGTTGNAKQGRNLLVYINPGWFGKFFETGAADGTTIATATLSGGPSKPEGKIWMLDVQNPKAFTDVDGVDYYKKTYVWSYIPDFEAGEDIWDDATP